jgi:hypothetical protein
MPEPEVVTEVDLLDRRLGYVLALVNIAGALLALGYFVVAIDEMTGGQLRRDFDQRLEAFKKARARRAEYAQSLKRVEFEAWRALREANDV